MRISSDRKPPPGFTLIEVLVVMLLIGLSLSVLFRLDYAPLSLRLENEARQFAGTASLVLDEAVLGGDYWGIDFFTDEQAGETVFGYRWLHRVEGSWREDVPVGLESLGSATLLEEDLALQLEVEGVETAISRRIDLQNDALVPDEFAPPVWLFPAHESTAFQLVFSSGDRDGLAVQTDILGRFTLLESGDEQ